MEPISYGRQWIDEADILAVTETLRSDYLTQGPKISEFEEKVAAYHNCRYAVAFANGTAALHGAYFASGIQKGDEFITTPNTFVASANGGLYMGAVPVLADIDPTTYNVCLEQIAQKITDKTKVITPVSYAGNPFDVKKLRKSIEHTDIVIIHDAAHAIGSLLDGDGVCAHADMAMLSFHPVKHVATGEGGMIVTNNQQYYEKLKLFRTHGITKDEHALQSNDGPWYYEMHQLGFNYRLTDMQAALGISQMDKLDASLYRRNTIANRYDDEFADVSWLTTPVNGFDRWNESKPTSLHAYHLYPILVDERIDRLHFFNYLRAQNILVQVHYIPMHYMPYYQNNFGYRKGEFPVCENFYSREISIPMFPTLTEEQQAYIIEKIKTYQR